MFFSCKRLHMNKILKEFDLVFCRFFSCQVQSHHSFQAFRRKPYFQKMMNLYWIVLLNQSQCPELFGNLITTKSLKVMKITVSNQILFKTVLQAHWRKRPALTTMGSTLALPKTICLQKTKSIVLQMSKFLVSDSKFCYRLFCCFVLTLFSCQAWQKLFIKIRYTVLKKKYNSGKARNFSVKVEFFSLRW